MKNLKAENKLVIALFIMVLVTFSFAQKDTKKLEQLYTQVSSKQALLASTPSTQEQVQQEESGQSAYFAKTAGSR